MLARVLMMNKLHVRVLLPLLAPLDLRRNELVELYVLRPDVPSELVVDGHSKQLYVCKVHCPVF